MVSASVCRVETLCLRDRLPAGSRLRTSAKNAVDNGGTCHRAKAEQDISAARHALDHLLDGSAIVDIRKFSARLGHAEERAQRRPAQLDSIEGRKRVW